MKVAAIAAKKKHEPKDDAEAKKWVAEAQSIIDLCEGEEQELSHVGFLAGLLIGHPIAPYWVQHIYWEPVEGITVTRHSGWANRYHDGHDEDGMDPPDIIAASRPDPKYYWFTDLVRSSQNIYNVLLGWLFGRVDLWDGPGRLVVHFGAGQETLELEFLAHPKSQWARIVELTKTIEAGLTGVAWLDQNPPYDIQVRNAAQFQLDVEHMMEKLRRG